MSIPRLGAASLNISWSDKDGFIVRHGQSKEVLTQVSPENLEFEDWNKLWAAIRQIEMDAYMRSPAGKALMQSLEPKEETK